jgi:hypothetical protein
MTGAILAGGLPAAIVAAVAALVVAATVLGPRWADGPTLVAAALIAQVAVADERRRWRAFVAALLLGVVLTSSEIAQTGARHTGWSAAVGVHGRPALASLIGIGAVTGAATAVVHDATLAAVLIGLAAAAALVTLQLTHKLLRNQRLPPE